MYLIRRIEGPSDRVEEYAKLLEWLLAFHVGQPDMGEALVFLGTHVQRNADKFSSIDEVKWGIDICNRIKHTIPDVESPGPDQIARAVECLDRAVVEVLRYAPESVRRVVGADPTFPALGALQRRWRERVADRPGLSSGTVLLQLYLYRMLAHPTRGVGRAQVVAAIGFLLFREAPIWKHFLHPRWRSRALEALRAGAAAPSGPVVLPAGKKPLAAIRKEKDAADRVEDYARLLEWLLVAFVAETDLKQDLSTHVGANSWMFSSLPSVYFGLGVYNDLKHAVSARAPREQSEIGLAAHNLERAVVEVLPYTPWSVQRAAAVDGLLSRVRRGAILCVAIFGVLFILPIISAALRVIWSGQ